MSSNIDSLKLQLKSVLNRKNVNDKLEYQLRTTERNLSEQLSVVTYEINLLTGQLQTLNKSMSEAKHEIAKIEICKVSEQSKMKEQLEILNKHGESFENFFTKERTIQLADSKAKEAEVEEFKKKQLEDQEKHKAIVLAMEEEIESIELECAVIKKRNKAIMLKLKRQLLETDVIRKALIKTKP